MKQDSSEIDDMPLRKVSFDDVGVFQALVGELSKNIKQIEKALGLKYICKGEHCTYSGGDSFRRCCRKTP